MKHVLIQTILVVTVSLLGIGCVRNFTPYGKRLDSGQQIQLNTEPSEVQIAVTYFGRNGFPSKTFSPIQAPFRWGQARVFNIAPEVREWQGLTSNIDKITISKPGYYSMTLTSDDIAASGWSKEVFGVKYTHPYKVILKKMSNFQGSTENPAKISVRLNSEPAGASVYENGKKVGVTPCTVSYHLIPQNYQTGRFQSTPFIFVKEGYFAKEKTLLLVIDREWRYRVGELVLVAHDLTVLNPNPDFRPRPIVNNTYVAPGQQSAKEVTVINKEGNKIRDFANTMSAVEYLIHLAK